MPSVVFDGDIGCFFFFSTCWLLCANCLRPESIKPGSEWCFNTDIHRKLKMSWRIMLQVVWSDKVAICVSRWKSLPNDKQGIVPWEHWERSFHCEIHSLGQPWGTGHGHQGLLSHSSRSYISASRFSYWNHILLWFFLVSNIFNVLYVKHICRLEKNKKNTHKNNIFLFFLFILVYSF